MMQTAPTTPAPIAPPEGEHVMFASVDDGIELTVRSKPNWWHLLPASLLMLVILACVFELLARPMGTPWPFLMAAILITGIVFAGLLWLLMDSILGFEVVRVNRSEILITQRTLLPMRRETLCRADAHDLRVLPEDLRLGPFRFSCYSKRFGRIGLTHRRKLVRFGTPLADDEARAVCAFLLAVCPDLGSRESENKVMRGT